MFGLFRKTPSEVKVTAKHLAALDKARDYDAASSYNYLNAELAKLRDALRRGGTVRIEGADAPVILDTLAEYSAWAGARYPKADPV